jgi:hypothetical protein
VQEHSEDSNLNVAQEIRGAITISQKECQMDPKNSQDWRNIYVLPFKTMAIMASLYFLFHMNVKEFKPKIHLIKI